MILHCHPNSPYARKVMILARLKGLELNEVIATADGPRGYTGGDNPLGKIPALEWQPGDFLYDSPVICEYVDSLCDPILPTEGARRYQQLGLHALGDGLSDAVYNYRYETVRDQKLHWPQMIERHETALRNIIAHLEGQIDTLGTPWGYGNLAVVCALDYMGYRAGHMNWRDMAPNLAEWHANFTTNEAYRDTYSYPDI